jgi:hypothetical protein
MNTEASILKAQIEAAAVRLGMSPSTVGERVGQGGKFYSRLCAGKRVWPETAAKVRERLAEIETQRIDGAA